MQLQFYHKSFHETASVKTIMNSMHWCKKNESERVRFYSSEVGPKKVNLKLWFDRYLFASTFLVSDTHWAIPRIPFITVASSTTIECAYDKLFAFNDIITGLFPTRRWCTVCIHFIHSTFGLKFSERGGFVFPFISFACSRKANQSNGEVCDSRWCFHYLAWYRSVVSLSSFLLFVIYPNLFELRTT